MCGRIRQSNEPDEYFATVFTDMHTVFKLERPTATENVPPGSKPYVIHSLTGEPMIGRWHWQYVPPWAERKYVTPNAAIEKIMSDSNWWAGPIKHGRMIIPAEGWYEWTGKKPNKQPWYIRPHDGETLWMAAISGWRPDLYWKDSEMTNGFVIVTDQSAGGMVDVHDRRPIVLTLDDALEWMDPATTTDQAKQILTTPRPESAFEWYEVTKRMGNSTYQGKDASEPIS